MLFVKHSGTRQMDPSCGCAALGVDHGVKTNESEVCSENHEVGSP